VVSAPGRLRVSGYQAPTSLDVVMPQLISGPDRLPRYHRPTNQLHALLVSTSNFSFNLDLNLLFIQSINQSIIISISENLQPFHSISSGIGSPCIALAHLPCPLLHAMAPDAQESSLVPPIVQNTPNASPEHDSLIPQKTSGTNRTQSSFAVTVEAHDVPTHTWSPPPVRTLPGM
jgi:hypothetical protein